MKPPTGSTEMPRRVKKRANMIYDEIRKEERIGSAAGNDTESFNEKDDDKKAQQDKFGGSKTV